LFDPEDAVWSEIKSNGHSWREVKLSAPKGRALSAFAARRTLIMSLLGGGLSELDVDQFASTIGVWPGAYLIVNPQEVLGGLSLGDEDHMDAFALALEAVAAGQPAEVLRVTEPYVGKLGDEKKNWECQVFGYTYPQ
jgi:hypothetical protein